MPFERLSSPTLTSVRVLHRLLQMKAEALLNGSSRSSNIAPAGLPGNDDQAAMATWLIWHLLGLYPGLLGSSPKRYSITL